ncbi:antibiotic biosynthesis monooxygenase [Nonlabens sp. YIK11]|uniref:putative quinol monooxygenase n=1 Tax=Nonlabens sp. YIK11 TaxID=1453349 RepID=UPI0006DC7BF3|nr:antibiotic biosynthesis monooxygenase family protein [Nonlabens sp. YIK11]KQC33546.1 antibiotic biosynthesis monooxygenase [Nonlabens sp. YIK11]
MIVRIVQMHFSENKIDDFKVLFEDIKEKIRHQPGCEFLELYQGTDDPQTFFTYSYWNSSTDLNNYRNSALFQEIWPKTKAMFDQKPIATSVEKLHSLS